MTKKLPSNANLKQISTTLEEMNTTLNSELTRFKGVLENKGAYVYNPNLSNMINLVNSDFSYGWNTKPSIDEFDVTEWGATYAIIKYKISDSDNQIVRHLLYVRQGGEYVGDYRGKDITKEVGYEADENGYFSYIIKGLAPNTYTDISFNVTDGMTTSGSKSIGIYTKENCIYGFEVDETNPNPETSVKYIKDALGMIPGKNGSLGSWANAPIIKKIRQCGVKNAKVFKYLNPMNEKLYEDGTSVDKTADIMTQFPKLYWKWTNTQTGYIVEITDVKPPGWRGDGFDCPAHKIGDTEYPHCYISCYKGVVQKGKFRSVINVIPEGINGKGIPYQQLRDYIKANNPNYTAFSFQSLKLLQILYILVYKNLNSQEALGQGRVWDPGNFRVRTGNLFDKGLCYGDSSVRNKSVKLFGIEDLWGGPFSTLVDGICLNDNDNVLISNNDVFNDTGTGYVDTGFRLLNIGNLGPVGGYVSKIQGGDLGFIGAEFTGSNASFYCDNHRDIDGGAMKFMELYDGPQSEGNAGLFAQNFTLYGSNFTKNALVQTTYMSFIGE